MSILNPLFDAVAWVIMRIHAVLAVPFGPDSGVTWGLSIVILVMLMRLIMVPLFVKQVKSQRKMQAHMPQLQEIRKRYKNDKQRLNEETMKFYKENGINPLGGCLPLLAQLPVFWSLFNVLKAIADWTPPAAGHAPAQPAYGLTIAVVESAQKARVFGAALGDKFLFPVNGETWPERIVILLFVAISASTTFLTMRQSAKRGMLNQTPPDPDQPGAQMAASMSKNMMYIAPFFALTGLYWQFGLVIYWVTTNVWTLCQQHILFRNLPVVGSTTVGASAAAAPSGNTGAVAKSASAGTAAKKSGAVSSGAAARAKTSTSASGAASSGAKVPAAKAAANGAAAGKTGAASAAAANGSGRGLLGFGKSKAEPEVVQAAPPTKVVRQQPVRQSRSKRGNPGKR